MVSNGYALDSLIDCDNGAESHAPAGNIYSLNTSILFLSSRFSIKYNVSYQL